MAIPDYQKLMLPVLEFAARGETSVRDCVVALAEKLDLTDEERSELLPSGRQAVFANRVHWAKTYLVQAGLLEITRRAHFKLTSRGSEVLIKRPANVDNELLMQFSAFREFRERSRSSVEPPKGYLSPPAISRRPQRPMRSASRSALFSSMAMN